MAQMGRFLYCPINLAIALTTPRKLVEALDSRGAAGISIGKRLVNTRPRPRPEHGIIVSQRRQ
jgi:hypothetical protein